MSQSKYYNKSIRQIVSDLELVNVLVDYHYEIESEACSTADVTSPETVEYIATVLSEYDNDKMSWNAYMRLAQSILDEIADDIIDEIRDRDNDAIESENERREAMKGEY